MVFFGEYSLVFSEGGRIVLPKKIRRLIKGTVFVLTKGFGSYLAGYDRKDWEKRAEEFLGASLLEEENLGKRRFVFSSAVYLEIDSQGRFVVPKNLISYLGFDKRVVVVGVGDHFEIWSAKRWQKYLKSNKSL